MALDTRAPASSRAARRLLLALPVVIFELAAWSRRWVTEDAFIYFRVVDNLLAGHGPVFNSGERVEAATGTVWTGLLAVGRLLFGWLLPIEWIAVVLGLVCAGFAILAAQLGAARLFRGQRDRWLLPAGVLVVLALPPMWEFATSGLESSLELAWIAGVFWALATRQAVAQPASRPRWLSMVIGLGPLIRPDLAIFTVVYLVALWLVSPKSWRDRGASLGWALLVPALWQVFRMGFFGALVPNTAIAKSAGSANWSQGWAYLVDFVTPYRLAAPVLVLAVLFVAVHPLRAGRDAQIVAYAPIIAAVVSAIYVMRLGGDFMHARFLVPAVFAAVLPVSVVPLPTRAAMATTTRAVAVAACAVLLASWGLVASRATLPYARDINSDGIADERGFWQRAAGVEHPVTLDDFRSSFLVADAQDHLRQARELGGDAIVFDLGDERGAARSLPGTGAHLAYRNIGVYGLAAGAGTTVFDPHGLSDPVAARIELTSDRERPGHEKNLPPVWILARHAAPTAADPPELRAARHALQCGDLAELLDAANAPLTPRRALDNLLGATRRTRVVVPLDPLVAERTFCGST